MVIRPHLGTIQLKKHLELEFRLFNDGI